MCLGIPGLIVETNVTHEHLARVEVNGVGRIINVALLEDEHLVVGDWVLIHEEDARLALASLQMMGELFTAEVDAMMTSPSTTTGVPTRGVSEQWESSSG